MILLLIEGDLDLEAGCIAGGPHSSLAIFDEMFCDRLSWTGSDLIMLWS